MKRFLDMIFGIQSQLTQVLIVFFKGRYVGTDYIGNKYYQGKARKNYVHNRRWVKYASVNPDASQVPPEYHAWLHHQSDTFPDESQETFRKPWQKSHQPNLTGTTLAYRPPGHQLQGGQRNRATGDYEAWTPDQ